MKLKLILAVVLAAVLMTACCPCKKYQKKYGKPLQQTQWSMVQMDGRSFSPGENYVVVFATDGSISGVGDCNRLMGKYTADQATGKIVVDMLASTRMMCPNQAQEGKFMAMLQSVDAYTLDGPRLMLFKNGELISVFEAGKSVNK